MEGGRLVRGDRGVKGQACDGAAGLQGKTSLWGGRLVMGQACGDRPVRKRQVCERARL